MAKESYFNIELELNKNNLKKTWEILRQAIHKQNNRPTKLEGARASTGLTLCVDISSGEMKVIRIRSDYLAGYG